MKKNEDESLLDVIKMATGVEKQTEISKVLGLSPQDFNNRKRRGTLRPVLLDFAAKNGIQVPVEDKTAVNESFPRFGVKEIHHPTLRPDQDELLRHFDLLSQDQRDMVLTMVKGFAGQCAKSAKEDNPGGTSQESNCA